MSVYEQGKCQTYWGSHGCGGPRGHDGDHWCQDREETEPHSTITQDGTDSDGFHWDLYRDDVPDGWAIPHA